MTTISPIQSLPPLSAGTSTAGISGPGGFASLFDAAKAGLGEVDRMQHASADASKALALGETDDIVGTMATVEKADLAFKTLLAVRSKLMSAFDEIRNMPV